MTRVILLILVIGIIFRLFISSQGNFIFNMDNARDAVDVREMVVLKNLRLIGPTTAIDGFYNGPGWYYLLSIPFVLSGGDPYAAILMEIILWAIGGYFLLMLTYRFYGLLAMIAVSSIWLFSNFIILGTQYSFNPNPTLFLTPVFVYFLLRYLETGKLLFSILSWFLVGIFLHFEIVVGIFMPVVIILAIILLKKTNYLKSKNFYWGLVAYFTTFMPQILFELTHGFFLTKSLLAYRSSSHGIIGQTIFERSWSILKSFYDIFLPTLMNFKLFTNLILIILGALCIKALKEKKLVKDNLTLIAMLITLLPLIGLIPLKVELMRWHLNGSVIGAIFLIGWVIYSLQNIKLGKLFAWLLIGMIVTFSIQNAFDYVRAAERGGGGNSHLRVELSAIDYVYRESQGKNFKVYTYLPSVYDWPYQYLFWWHGLKKYGYTPEEYAYAPNKPPYVPGKENLGGGGSPESSGLIYLIKEPDQGGIRHLWENTFRDLELIKSENIGPLIIETRKQ